VNEVITLQAFSQEERQNLRDCLVSLLSGNQSASFDVGVREGSRQYFTEIA